MKRKSDDSALKMATGMLETGLAGLYEFVRDRAKRLGPDDAVISDAAEYAHLLVKIAQVTGELRKAEAEERKRAESMTAVAWVDWYRQQKNPAERARLLRELQQLDSTKSVLS
jgi:hypothetical protein